MQPGLVSPVFVGRAAELGSMLAAFESAVGGDPAVVIVGGEAGVGSEPDSVAASGGRDIDSYGLTERELEVLHLVAAGRSNPQIATELFISASGLETHQ